LPILELVPKPRVIAAMWDDVIDDGRERDAARRETLGHHGRASVRAHPAERIPRAEETRAAAPAFRIPARIGRPARPLELARVHRAAARRDELRATGLSAKRHALKTASINVFSGRAIAVGGRMIFVAWAVAILIPRES